MQRLTGLRLLLLMLAAAAAPPTVEGHLPFRPQVSVAVPGSLVGPGPVLTGCRLDLHYFRNFTTGVVDYCRGHLGYEPGALDCYQFTEQVCSVFLPESVEWLETRQPFAPAVFPCPDAPEPPVCPRLNWR